MRVNKQVVPSPLPRITPDDRLGPIPYRPHTDLWLQKVVQFCVAHDYNTIVMCE